MREEKKIEFTKIYETKTCQLFHNLLLPLYSLTELPFLLERNVAKKKELKLELFAYIFLRNALFAHVEMHSHIAWHLTRKAMVSEEIRSRTYQLHH